MKKNYFDSIKYRGIDKIYEEKGISYEQLTHATQYYQSENEPELHNFMTEKTLEINQLKEKSYSGSIQQSFWDPKKTKLVS